MIKKNFFLLLVLLIITMISFAGCSSDKNKISTESTPTTQAASQSTQTTQSTQASQINNPTIIYIYSVSNSIRSIDRYSLTRNGDICDALLGFDTTCKYYNNLNQEISFYDFSTIIYNSNLQKNSVQCKIIKSTEKLISEVYLID